jgi:predicted outer membrane repeat protein
VGQGVKARATGGGAIFNDAPGTLDVHGSTLSGNSASDSGGALYNAGTATVQQCTLSGNSAASNGGGIFNAASGTLTIDDSVVLNNLALLGADLYNLGKLTLNDSTVGVIGP